MKITIIRRAEDEMYIPRRIGLKSISPSVEILDKIAARIHLCLVMLDDTFVEGVSERSRTIMFDLHRPRSENSWIISENKKVFIGKVELGLNLCAMKQVQDTGYSI